jgi:tetratricopeptide (TPR) repeat protein
MKSIILCLMTALSANNQNYSIVKSATPTVISNTPDELINQSREKFGRKDFAGAMDDLNKVIKTNPKNAIAYNGRGLVKFILSDLKGSMADYNMAITLDPKYAGAYNNRGALKLHRGDFDNALVDITKAITLDPNLADAYNNRGTVFSQLGKREVAIKDYEKAIKLYEAQGDKKSARQLLETIKKFNRAKV